MAQAEHDRLLARSSAAADVFAYRLSARESAPALTDFRLFWETIAEVLANKPKLILDAAAGRPQRLILSRLPAEQSAILSEAPGQNKKKRLNNRRNINHQSSWT